MTSTKTYKLMQLLRQMPDLSASEAENRGYSKSTYFTARKLLKEEEEKNPEHKQHMELVHLVQRIEQMGIIELHYKKGQDVEVVRTMKQRVKVEQP